MQPPGIGTATTVTSTWRCADLCYSSAPVIESDSDSVAEEIPHHKPEPSEQVQDELEDALPVTDEAKGEKNRDDGADNVEDDEGDDDDDEEV